MSTATFSVNINLPSRFMNGKELISPSHHSNYTATYRITSFKKVSYLNN
jgi:hypothetical protein